MKKKIFGIKIREVGTGKFLESRDKEVHKCWTRIQICWDCQNG